VPGDFHFGFPQCHDATPKRVGYRRDFSLGRRSPVVTAVVLSKRRVVPRQNKIALVSVFSEPTAGLFLRQKRSGVGLLSLHVSELAQLRNSGGEVSPRKCARFARGARRRVSETAVAVAM
jgi:hypothetical protein